MFVQPVLNLNNGFQNLKLWVPGKPQGILCQSQGYLRCFRDLIRVPRIRENQVPKIREIGSLQVHTGYLTFSIKKKLVKAQ